MTDESVANKLQKRRKSYNSTTDGLLIPVDTSIVDNVSSSTGVESSVLSSAIQEHQQDIHSDGTVFAYAKQLLNNNECRWFHCTDHELYLGVDNGVWEREKSWFNHTDDVFDALKKSHTKEVETVCQIVTEQKIPDEIDCGYVVGIQFPLASTAQSEEITVPAFNLAERAEFLHRDAGLPPTHASTYVLFNWLTSHGGFTQSNAFRMTSDIIGVETETTKNNIHSVQQWEENIEQVVNNMANRVGQFDDSPPDVFGAVASMGISDEK